MNLIYEISFFSEIITDEVCFDGRPDNQCFDDNAACKLTMRNKDMGINNLIIK
jgi:hypothetical protein